MIGTHAQRLIEVDLPIRAISEHARKDQNIRKGHLHTMHVWWATRPLASCRAVIMATLLPDPADPNCPTDFVRQARDLMRQWACQHASKAGSQGFSRVVKIQKDLSILDDPVELRGALLDFIADFAAWDAGVDPDYLRTARSLVAAAHPDGPPLVLDPFAGAGSIPFEALRVGAQAFAGDLNPVAVLINKVALEYLPKYGKAEVRMQKAEGGTVVLHGLAEAVDYWGKWVLEEARKRLAPYYPADSKGNIPLAYIWARTITCEGPGCGAEVPLLGMLWLSHKSKNRVALRYHGDKKTKQVHVEVFKPRSATDLQPPLTQRFSATCPVCSFTTPYKSVREQLRQRRGGTRDARMVAVIMVAPSGTRTFHVPTDEDCSVVKKAERAVGEQSRACKGPLSLVPDEPTPECRGPGASRAFSVQRYGMTNWSDVYMPRQALTMTSFVETVREARERIAKESGDKGYADAVATCLALAVSNMSHYLSSVSIWASDGMISAFVQGSGMAMRPDFAEANPLMPKLVVSCFSRNWRNPPSELHLWGGTRRRIVQCRESDGISVALRRWPSCGST